jgi:hypothetical protein
LDVYNVVQGEPIAICHDSIGGWAAVWPRLTHKD